jgi:type IV fimbrial biogenesis protein FimT
MTRRNNAGFSLLELMVTVSIMAILISLGVPAFQDFAMKQRLNAAVNALHNDLLLARAQAIHRDMQVIACAWTAGSGCTGKTDWTDGWIVFGDSNEDNNFQDGEPVLRHGQKVENVMIHSTTGRTHFRFYSNGTAPGSNGSISLCGLGGPKKARKLVISNLGRVRRDIANSLDEAYCP